MKKLQRDHCFGLSMVAAALVLVAGVPASALAADEESGGSPPGETVVEPSGGSTQPTAPAAPSPAPSAPPSTGWTPQGGGTGGSTGGGSSVRHGSGVGSGGVPGKTGGSSEEESSYTPPDTSAYAPAPSTQSAPSTSSTSGEPASTPREAPAVHPVKPPVETDSTEEAAKVAVGTAAPLASPEPRQSSDVSETPTTTAAFTDSGDQAGSGSDAMSLLLVVLASLVLGYAAVRLWRRHERRRVEDLKRQRDATWEAVVGQIKADRQLAASQAPAPSRTSAERHTIDVG
jgi:hypothetical protein